MAVIALTVLAATVAVLAIAAGALAQDLQSQLDSKRAQLEEANAKEGVLSSTIQRLGERLDQLRGEVATLRNREAIVQAELDKKEAELKRAKERLAVLRARLKRSLKVLRERLVAIYESSRPDMLTVILNSDGFDDLLSRYEYLQRIQSKDTSIAVRVRDLRDETKDIVEQVRAARDEIAAKRAELARTRSELESREGDLAVAQQQDQQALAQVAGSPAPARGRYRRPRGPDPVAASGSLLVGAGSARRADPGRERRGVHLARERGGRLRLRHAVGAVARRGRHRGAGRHADQAAASGTVVLAAYTGGYGNYTCIDHGGGVSTCYAHQSSLCGVVGQSVDQGQVIGSVGCTGHCFGDHLHFEVRVNGSPVDPMGYLVARARFGVGRARFGIAAEGARAGN